MTEDDGFISKSEIISSDQLSRDSPGQGTEQINLEFSEDYRENDIREGPAQPWCSIHLIGRKPLRMPSKAPSSLFCMSQSSKPICKHLLGDQKSTWGWEEFNLKRRAVKTK